MFQVLEPSGIIALQERALIFNAVGLMLIVVVPVYLLIFFFAYYYRAGNAKAKYMPDWEHAKMDELIWWAIPLEIVLVLGALTWGSTHELDPRKALTSDVAPLEIQVVALQWKWLFLYPQQKIATVNYVQFPVGTPIKFSITADAPMNSFWIPQLGGQIYAMTGMVTALNLMADTVGTFPGASSNYSGDGFAQMQFKATASSKQEFDDWVAQVKRSSTLLDMKTYAQLRKPSVDNTLYFALNDDGLFGSIIAQFNPSPMQMNH